MAHFIRISFCIVALALTFTSSLPTPSPIETDYNISFMRKEVDCDSDSKFYSPREVKPECITSALNCILKELATVRSECNDENDRTEQAEEALSAAIFERANSTAQENSSECVCEKWKEEPFQDFLDSYRDVLHQMKAQASL